MGLFDRFPYSNFHELNLTWILEMLQKIDKTMDEFVAINALKYADPIQWDITKQYEKNTIVIDPLTGTAYISVQPVPSGVALTNTDYWTVVFDLGQFVVKASKNFADKYEEATTLTATFPSNAGDWLIWGDTLYKALVNITAGDQYVENSNIEHFTMEDIVGHPELLLTTAQDNLVNAINELVTKLGDLDSLHTTDKSSAVAAINEVLQTLIDTVGDLDNLTTTDKSNIVAAINELKLNNIKVYNSLAAILSDSSLQNGDIVATTNYYDDEAGGGAYYTITDTATPDGYTIYNLTNGLFAVLSSSWSLRRLGARDNMDITDLWRFYMANSDRDADIIVEKGTYLSRYMMIYGHDRVIDFNNSTIIQIEDPDEYHSGISLNLTSGSEERKNIVIRNLILDVSQMVYQSPIYSRPFNINTQDSGKVHDIHYQNINVIGGSSATDFWHVWFINADNGKDNIYNIFIENCSNDYAYNGCIYIVHAKNISIRDSKLSAYISNVINQTVPGADCDLITVDNSNLSVDDTSGAGAAIHTGNAILRAINSNISGAQYGIITSNGGSFYIDNSVINAVTQGIRLDTVAAKAFLSNSVVNAATTLFDNIGSVFELSNVILSSDSFIIQGKTIVKGNWSDYRGQFAIPASVSAGDFNPASVFRVTHDGSGKITIPKPCLIFGNLTNTNSDSVTLQIINADTSAVVYNAISTSPNTPVLWLNRNVDNISLRMSANYTSSTASVIFVMPI